MARSITNLSALSSAIDEGSSYFAAASIGVQIALSGSLSLLWGMVNTLQIIIQMPLVNLTLPPNAMILSKSLASMASFDFIPVNSIN